jgi:hypothetical protein
MGYGNQGQLTQLGLLGGTNAANQAQANFNTQQANASAQGWGGLLGTGAGIGANIYNNWKPSASGGGGYTPDPAIGYANDYGGYSWSD